MCDTFGSYLRQRREELLKRNPEYTVRGLAAKIGIQPSYVSKVEREEVPPPSEATIVRMAEALHEDPDVLLALAGKVSVEIRQIIAKRPLLFAPLIRHLKDAPDDALREIVANVQEMRWGTRDG